MLAYIPSPPQGVWYIGSFPLRAYALCIIVGIIVIVAGLTFFPSLALGPIAEALS